MLESKKFFLASFAATFLVWLLSFLAFVVPTLQPFLVALFLVGFTVLAFRNYSIALLVFLFELAVGNKGSLFSIPIMDFSVGIRLVLFAILFLAWFYYAVRSGKLFALRQTPYFWPWLAFLAVILYGVVYGYLRTRSSLVYFDANGYLFYLIFLPLSLVMMHKAWWERLKFVILGATTATALLTIILSASFTIFFPTGATEATNLTEEQRIALAGEAAREGDLAQTTTLSAGKIVLEPGEARGIATVYRWLRDTGNGEVSFIGNSFFRIFFISHVFVFLSFLWLLVFLTQQGKFFSAAARHMLILAAVHGLAMAISFSRSLWLGLGFGLILALVLLPQRLRRRALVVLAAGVLGCILLFGVLWPGIGDLFMNRIMSIVRPTQELASSTRLSLLEPIIDKIQERPLTGWGFGTTVSFLAPIAGTDVVKTIQVYLFEWAYLDIAVKVGLAGLAVFVVLLGSAFRVAVRAWRRVHTWENAAVLSGLAFIATTHLTTPYLNHPLGIAVLALLMLYSFHNLHDA